MGIFFTSVLTLTFIFLSVRQIVRNMYGMDPVEVKTKLAPVVLFSMIAGLLSNLCAGGIVYERIPMFLMPGYSALYLISLSFIPDRWRRIAVIAAVSLECVGSCAVVACLRVFHVPVPSVCMQALCNAVSILVSLVFLFGIYRRLADIKLVMRIGSVWNVVCICVDVVYVVLGLLIALLFPFLHVFVIILLMASVAVALCVRIVNSSVFVLLVNHERRIVESMKISNVEYLSENPGTDLLYDNIYERVLGYFEKNRPYLNTDLTINDVVDVVFTNKLYISKAISHCTGRNFCQFVNYYRVTYAVELFRENPQLKVGELSGRSGFNSPNSFTAAFRLYMGEKPGEWCRKERARLTKK